LGVAVQWGWSRLQRRPRRAIGHGNRREGGWVAFGTNLLQVPSAQPSRSLASAPGWGGRRRAARGLPVHRPPEWPWGRAKTPAPDPASRLLQPQVESRREPHQAAAVPLRDTAMAPSISCSSKAPSICAHALALQQQALLSPEPRPSRAGELLVRTRSLGLGKGSKAGGAKASDIIAVITTIVEY